MLYPNRSYSASDPCMGVGVQSGHGRSVGAKNTQLPRSRLARRDELAEPDTDKFISGYKHTTARKAPKQRRGTGLGIGLVGSNTNVGSVQTSGSNVLPAINKAQSVPGLGGQYVHHHKLGSHSPTKGELAHNQIFGGDYGLGRQVTNQSRRESIRLDLTDGKTKSSHSEAAPAAHQVLRSVDELHARLAAAPKKGKLSARAHGDIFSEVLSLRTAMAKFHENATEGLLISVQKEGCHKHSSQRINKAGATSELFYGYADEHGLCENPACKHPLDIDMHDQTTWSFDLPTMLLGHKMKASRRGEPSMDSPHSNSSRSLHTYGRRNRDELGKHDLLLEEHEAEMLLDAVMEQLDPAQAAKLIQGQSLLDELTRSNVELAALGLVLKSYFTKDSTECLDYVAAKSEYDKCLKIWSSRVREMAMRETKAIEAIMLALDMQYNDHWAAQNKHGAGLLSSKKWLEKQYADVQAAQNLAVEKIEGTMRFMSDYEREAIREKMAWKEIEDAQEIAKLKSELDWVNSEIELCEVAALDLSVAEKTERLALDQMHVIATLTEDIQVKSKIEKKYGVKAFDKDSFDERLKSMDDKILAMQANDMKEFGTYSPATLKAMQDWHDEKMKLISNEAASLEYIRDSVRTEMIEINNKALLEWAATQDLKVRDLYLKIKGLKAMDPIDPVEIARLEALLESAVQRLWAMFTVTELSDLQRELETALAAGDQELILKIEAEIEEIIKALNLADLAANFYRSPQCPTENVDPATTITGFTVNPSVRTAMMELKHEYDTANRQLATVAAKESAIEQHQQEELLRAVMGSGKSTPSSKDAKELESQYTKLENQIESIKFRVIERSKRRKNATKGLSGIQLIKRMRELDIQDDEDRIKLAEAESALRTVDEILRKVIYRKCGGPDHPCQNMMPKFNIPGKKYGKFCKKCASEGHEAVPGRQEVSMLPGSTVGRGDTQLSLSIAEEEETSDFDSEDSEFEFISDEELDTIKQMGNYKNSLKRSKKKNTNLERWNVKGKLHASIEMRTMRSKRGDMTEKEWELVQQLHEGTNTSATIDSLTEMVFDAESNDTADSEEVDALAPLKVPRPRSKIESDMYADVRSNQIAAQISDNPVSGASAGLLRRQSQYLQHEIDTMKRLENARAAAREHAQQLEDAEKAELEELEHELKQAIERSRNERDEKKRLEEEQRIAELQAKQATLDAKRKAAEQEEMEALRRQSIVLAKQIAEKTRKASVSDTLRRLSAAKQMEERAKVRAKEAFEKQQKLNQIMLEKMVDELEEEERVLSRQSSALELNTVVRQGTVEDDIKEAEEEDCDYDDAVFNVLAEEDDGAPHERWGLRGIAPVWSSLVKGKSEMPAFSIITNMDDDTRDMLMADTIAHGKAKSVIKNRTKKGKGNKEREAEAEKARQKKREMLEREKALKKQQEEEAEAIRKQEEIDAKLAAAAIAEAEAMFKNFDDFDDFVTNADLSDDSGSEYESEDEGLAEGDIDNSSNGDGGDAPKSKRKKPRNRLMNDYDLDDYHEHAEKYHLSKEEERLLKKLKDRQAHDNQDPEGFAFKKKTTLHYLSDNCTISEFKLRLYSHVFQKSATGSGGVLTPQQLVRALRRVNKNLIGKDELKFIFFVLDIISDTGKHAHIDFKMFTAIAALSERIAPLENMISSFVDKADYSSLRVKVDKSNDMFKYLFSNAINLGGVSLDDLSIEFDAGNVNPEDKEEIIDTLRANGMDPLSFLDYLAYIPLFVDMHTGAMNAPLSMVKSESSGDSKGALKSKMQQAIEANRPPKFGDAVVQAKYASVDDDDDDESD